MTGIKCGGVCQRIREMLSLHILFILIKQGFCGIRQPG
jgi:hypothetical protein